MPNPGEGDGRHGSDRPWRWPVVIRVVVVVAAVGGLALRVFAPSPLWLDEALSVNIADLGFSDMVDALRRDGHPALYYLLLGVWIDLFGDGDVAVRAFSGLCSLLTVPVVWRLGHRIDAPTATAAAVLALVSPYLLRYGTEARMYALVVLLVALAWLAALRALEQPTVGRLAALAATSAALVHTHYWTFWVIGAGLLVVALRYRIADRHERGGLVRVAAAIIAGAATLGVWLGVLFDQASSTGTPWATAARPAEVLVETLEAIGGSARFEGRALGLLMAVLVLTGALAVGRRPDRIELRLRPAPPVALPAAMTVLTLTIGALAALATAGAFEGRYAAVVVPFLVVLAARGITVLPGAAPTVALAAVAVAGLLVGVDEARRDRTQGEAVADAVDAAARPGDVVVFCPDQLGPATIRTLDHDGPRVAYPSGAGTFVDWSDYRDRIAETDPALFVTSVDTLAGDHDVWLVTAFTYRGFEGRCESVLADLEAIRPATTVVTAGSVFEPMALVRFGAPT